MSDFLDDAGIIGLTQNPAPLLEQVFSQIAADEMLTTT